MKTNLQIPTNNFQAREPLNFELVGIRKFDVLLVDWD